MSEHLALRHEIKFESNKISIFPPREKNKTERKMPTLALEICEFHQSYF